MTKPQSPFKRGGGATFVTPLPPKFEKFPKSKISRFEL
jgi:hypothetical protein